MWTSTVDWLGQRDLRVCLALNRRATRPVIRLLHLASRLGDGPLWLACVPLVAAVYGRDPALRLFGGLLFAGALYRVTKQVTARPRPHVASPDIRLLAEPLDYYSFPSGHTLHAVTAAVMLSGLGAPWPWVVWPLTLAIAASRIVLGLHYPSDVVAGATLGAVIGIAGTSF